MRRDRRADNGADVSTITCPINALEREAVDEMKSMLGLTADANLMRAALYHYAAWLEPNINTSLFVIRRASDRVAEREARKRLSRERQANLGKAS
jgi:hypothetical protein